MQHWAINNRIGGNGKNGGDSIIRNTWMSTVSVGFSSYGLYPSTSTLHTIYFGIPTNAAIGYINIAGVWKSVQAAYVYQNGWKSVVSIHRYATEQWTKLL